MTEEEFGIYIVIGIILGAIGSGVASAKNRNAGLWFILCFLFGIFALLPLAFLEKKKKEGGGS